MKTIRWRMLAVFGICVLFAACGNPLVKNLTDSLFKKEPVSVSTPAGLAAIANNLNGYYKLTADIDLSSYGNWTPIGNYTTPFTGTFDGNGHTISGLTISSPYLQGLFGNILGGTVKNLDLTNVNINSTNRYIGGVAGYNDGGTIQNCYVTGTVTGDDSVGGIVGGNSGGIIENCYTTAAVTATVGDPGGITGTSTSMVKNCYATGSISGVITNPSGGLVGYIFGGGIVTNSVALNSTISGSSTSGRVSGGTAGTFSNNKARSTMTVNGGTVSGTLTDKHGADVNVGSAPYFSVFDGTWSPAVWNIPPGSMYGIGSPLPTLKGIRGTQNPTLP